MDPTATIFVVDDDPGVSRALQSVGQLLGLRVAAFASAAEFLTGYDRSQTGCLVLDLKMPEMTGLELQQHLVREEIDLPIIAISGHADVPIAVDVMSRGAVTLLEKPFRLDELIAQIRKALELEACRRGMRIAQADAKRRLARLTTREREVVDGIVAGKTNKEIAGQLALSLRAVEDRRSRLMKKVGARSVAELMTLLSQGDPPRV